MPGIVGLVTKKQREWAAPQLSRMVDSLRHESFYQAGVWENENSGVYIGWVARKGSFDDGMPLCNGTGSVVLAFSGEDFSQPGAIPRLSRRAHEGSAERPCYLVNAYEEDPAFPAGLNGRFHGIVADAARGQAVLFNDRYGMHRIYYHESTDAFYFAAEAKAILLVRPELKRVDTRSLGEYIACGCVLDNRTLFEGIHVLPPASAWVFRSGSLDRKGQYFQPREWEELPRLDAESYYRELRDTFSRILPRYFSGRERVAMSLTGGLDGRMIMAWQKPAPGSLPCFTFGDGTGIRECRDAIVAKQVAQACKQTHEVIPVGHEFLSHFPHYAERTVYLSDGCVGLTYSPDLYLNERARAIAPVRMTGNYGSEVLRASRAFKAVEPTPGIFDPDILPHVKAAGDTYADLLRGHPVSFAVFRQAPWHHYGLLALEQTQLALRSPYLDNELVRTVFQAPESALSTNDLCLRLIADGDPSLRRILTDRGLNGSGSHFTAAAYHSFLEFLFRAEYAYDSGMPQWLARIDHSLSLLHLERLFLGWHKFHHFRIWYRDALAGYVQDMLLDRCTLSRPFIQRRGVEQMVAGHLKGNRNYTTELHSVLTLELLHRLFVDSH